jgi:hypothetical protein
MHPARFPAAFCDRSNPRRVHHFAAMLCQQPQTAGTGLIGHPDPQPVPVLFSDSKPKISSAEPDHHPMVFSAESTGFTEKEKRTEKKERLRRLTP